MWVSYRGPTPTGQHWVVLKMKLILSWTKLRLMPNEVLLQVRMSKAIFSRWSWDFSPEIRISA